LPRAIGRENPCPVYRTVEAAAARGLDFIALTDHNSTAHFAALRALQGAFDRMLLLPGREITTFFGHANVSAPPARSTSA
jgi:predicted metal-dependent phosphoesterase TrpH